MAIPGIASAFSFLHPNRADAMARVIGSSPAAARAFSSAMEITDDVARSNALRGIAAKYQWGSAPAAPDPVSAPMGPRVAPPAQLGPEDALRRAVGSELGPISELPFPQVLDAERRLAMADGAENLISQPGPLPDFQVDLPMSRSGPDLSMAATPNMDPTGSFDASTLGMPYPGLGPIDTGVGLPSPGLGPVRINPAATPTPGFVSSGTMSIDDLIGQLGPAPAPRGPATMDDLLARIGSRDAPRNPAGTFNAGDRPVALGGEMQDVIGPAAEPDVLEMFLPFAEAQTISPGRFDGASGSLDATLSGGRGFSGQFDPAVRMPQSDMIDGIDPSSPPMQVNAGGSAAVDDVSDGTRRWGWTPMSSTADDAAQLDDLFLLDPPLSPRAADDVPTTPDRLGADGADIPEDMPVDPPPARTQTAAWQRGAATRAAYDRYLSGITPSLGRPDWLQALGLGMIGYGASQYLDGPDGPAVPPPEEPEAAELPTSGAAVSDSLEEQLMALVTPQDAVNDSAGVAVPSEEAPAIERLDGAPAFQMPAIDLGEVPDFLGNVESLIAGDMPQDDAAPPVALGPELSGRELAPAIRDLRERLARGILSPEAARVHPIFGRIPERQLELSIGYGSDLAERKARVRAAGMFGGTTGPGGWQGAIARGNVYNSLKTPEEQAAYADDYAAGRGSRQAMELVRQRLAREEEDARQQRALDATSETARLQSNTVLREAAMKAQADVESARYTASAAMAGTMREMAQAERALQQQALQYQQTESRLRAEGKIREAEIAAEARRQTLIAISAMRQSAESNRLRELEITTGQPPSPRSIMDSAAESQFSGAVHEDATTAQQRGMTRDEAYDYIKRSNPQAPPAVVNDILRQYYQ